MSVNAVKLYFFDNRRRVLAKGFCKSRLMRTILNAFVNDSALFKSEMIVLLSKLISIPAESQSRYWAKKL